MDLTPEHEEYLRNPAGKLYLFLDHTLNAPVPANATVRELWAAYFDVEPNSTDLLRLAAQMVLLPAEIERQVHELRNPVSPKAKLLKHLPSANAALSFVSGMDQEHTRVRQQFDPGTIASLDTLSDILNYDKHSFPAGASLENLRRLAEELREEIMGDESLDADLAKILLHHVGRIFATLNDVAVFGVEPLVDELDRLRGEVFRTPSFVQRAKRSPTFFQKFKELMIAATLLTTTLDSTLNLINSGAEMLELLQPDPTVVVIDESPAAETGP